MLVNVSLKWGAEFRCGGGCCSSGANACFLPSVIKDRFYVCNGWHSTPPLSVEADSNRAGVIVHEITHCFGTKDVRDISSCGSTSRCYGAEAARELAKDVTFKDGGEKCKALYSAENYEHFVSDVLVNMILVVN